MNKTYRDFDYKQMADGRILTDFPSIGQMLFKSEEEFRSYVDGYHATQGFFRGIEHELRNAIEKHPKFCDAVVSPNASVSWAESERSIKLRNECGPWTADNILMEEVCEAFNAYQQGRFKDSLQEFEQVGAVVIRCMDVVKKELEASNERPA